MSSFTSSIEHFTGGLNQCNKARKINNRYTKWKNKTVLHTSDTIIYVENPKTSKNNNKINK